MGFTGVKTYRTLGDPSFAILGEAVYGVDMSAYTWVYMPPGDIRILKSDVRTPSSRTIGLVLYDGLEDEAAVVAFGGEVTIEIGGLIPGQIYYADPLVFGGMTVTRPPGEYQIVGIAVTEWRFMISIQSYFAVSDNLLYFNSDQEAFDAGFLLYKTGTQHESGMYGVIKEVHPDIS